MDFAKGTEKALRQLEKTRGNKSSLPKNEHLGNEIKRAFGWDVLKVRR